jgi:hypothetical protein
VSDDDSLFSFSDLKSLKNDISNQTQNIIQRVNSTLTNNDYENILNNLDLSDERIKKKEFCTYLKYNNSNADALGDEPETPLKVFEHNYDNISI